MGTINPGEYLEIKREPLLIKLEKGLKPKDFAHSLRTAKIANDIAGLHKINSDKAYIAGLLHDCGKILSCQAMVAKAEELGLEIDSVDRQYPYLLHARIGAIVAKQDFLIDDEEIIKAIERHTLGWLEMSDLDKLIYLVDMIEPARKFQGVDELRRLVHENLDLAFKRGYKYSLSYIIQRGKLFHPLTTEVWNKLIVRDGKDEGWL